MKPIRFKTSIALLSYLPGMHVIVIPKKVVDTIGKGFKLRVICEVTGPKKKRVSFPGGFMAYGEGQAYISMTKKRMKEIDVALDSRIEVCLKSDRSEFGAEMPEELREILNQDAAGRARFEKLTPGRQRYIIQYVGSVKNSASRIERALLLIENLKRLPVGQESFRAMLGK